MLTRSILLLACISMVAPATADDVQKRLEREATEIFRVILTEESGSPTPCAFSAKWMSYPIPHFIAQKYMGLTLFADVEPPYQPASPIAIIDPTGKSAASFCSDDDIEKEKEKLFSTSEPTAANPKEAETTRSLEILRREFTFPVFDKRLRRAALIVSGTEYFWIKKPGEKLKRSRHLMGGASIYIKRNGRWRFLRHENLFHATG